MVGIGPYIGVGRRLVRSPRNTPAPTLLAAPERAALEAFIASKAGVTL